MDFETAKTSIATALQEGNQAKAEQLAAEYKRAQALEKIATALQEGNQDRAEQIAEEFKSGAAPVQQKPSEAEPPEEKDSKLFQVLKSSMGVSSADRDNTKGFITQAQDDALLGGGNELVAGVGAAKDALLSDKGFKEGYKERMQEAEAAKQQFRQRDPVGSFATSIASAGPVGGAVSTAVKAPTFLKAATLGAAEGTAYGALSAKPGERDTGAMVGAIGGAGGATVFPALSKLIKGGKKVYTGMSDMVTGGKKASPKVRDEMADDIVANHLLRTGRKPTGPGGLAQKLSRADSNATVADTLEEPNLLAAVTSMTDKTANKGRVALKDRAKNTVERVREKFGTSSKTIDDNLELEEGIEGARKAIGDDIEKLVADSHGTPLKNQDEILDFMGKGHVKSVLKKVKDDLELDGRLPRYREEVPGMTGDGNLPVIDESYAQAVSSRLGRKVQREKAKGVDYAAAAKVRKQWDELITRNASDSTLKDLRTEYGRTKGLQRAFESGKDSYGSLAEDGVKKQMDGLVGDDLAAYRSGVETHYANQGEGLLKSLGSDKERRKIAEVFGGSRSKRAEGIVSTENTYQTTADALTAGVKARDAQTAAQSAGGVMSSVKDLWGRLRGKRAYSPVGGAFMVANEVIDASLRTDVPDEVLEKIFKMLSSTGGDADKIITRLNNIAMPNIAKKKEILEAAKQAARDRMGTQATSTAAALTGMMPESTVEE